MRVEIPALLPKEANPNWRGHWSKKAKAVKEFREMAMYCAINAYEGVIPVGVMYVKAKVAVTLVIPDRRYYRDPDNALASLKPAIDGCVDAGVILGDDDKHLRYKLPITYRINRQEAPKTILDFEELKDCPPHEWVIDEHDVGRCKNCPAVRDFGALQQGEAKHAAGMIHTAQQRGGKRGKPRKEE